MEVENGALFSGPSLRELREAGTDYVLKEDYDQLLHRICCLENKSVTETKALKSEIESQRQECEAALQREERLEDELKLIRETVDDLNKNYVNKTPLERLFDPIPSVTKALPEGHTMSPSDVEACGTLLGVPDFNAFCNELPEELTTTAKHGNAMFCKRLLLAICLFWLRRGFSYVVLAYLACTVESTVRSWLDPIIWSLLPWAESQIHLPGVPEWLASLTPEFIRDYPNTLMMFVDGTPVEIFSPSNVGLKQIMWNSKHAMSAFCFSAMCDLNGVVRWYSGIVGGKINDATCWNESRVAENLKTFYGPLFAMYPHLKFAICGDKAYPCIELPNGMFIFVTKSAEETIANEEAEPAPHRPPSHTPSKVSTDPGVNRSNEDNRVLCPKVAQYRSVIERTFKRIKAWQLLKSRSQMSGDPTRLDKIIKVIIALENWSLTWRLQHNQQE